MDISGKKLLLVGGAGLIGSHTADLLIKQDVKEIVIYDNFARGNLENLKDALKDPRVKIFDVGGDILQTDILEKAVSQCDGVFHFAALWLLHCHDYPRSAFETNVAGTFNLLDICAKHKVERIVFSSSASVYGDAIEQPMREDHPFNNKTFYGATKIAGEALIRAFYYRYGLDYVGLRYMNVYGPRQDYKGAYIAVIMKMLDAIESGDGPTIYGDGKEEFDFVNVLDCARANICAMKADASNTFLNIGSGKGTKLEELAKMLLKLTNSSKLIQYKLIENSTLVKNRIGCVKKQKKKLVLYLRFPYTMD